MQRLNIILSVSISQLWDVGLFPTADELPLCGLKGYAKSKSNSTPVCNCTMMPRKELEL